MEGYRFWCDMVTILIPFVSILPMMMMNLPLGVSARFMEGTFLEASRSGELAQLYEMREDFRSCAACTMTCLEDVATPCAAFRCQSSTVMTSLTVKVMTCQFYKEWGSPVAAPAVPLFWFKVTDVFHRIALQGGEYSVYLSSLEKTYVDARQHCHDLGAYLLQFDSSEEYEAVSMVSSRQFESTYSFVGANDLANETEWVTDREGAALTDGVWQWFDDKPDDTFGNQDCAILVHHRSLLNDNSCTKLSTFFCEKDL